MLYSNSPLSQFNINPILSFYLGWIDLSFTNSSLAILGACFFFILFVTVSASAATVIPTRWQSVLELLYEFIYLNIKW